MCFFNEFNGLIKHRRILSTALLTCVLFVTPALLPAQDPAVPLSEGRLLIATTDNSPISTDRLLYLALKKINYVGSFVYPIVQEGYNGANDGIYDGVVSAYPDLDSVYTGLRKVPYPIEQIDVRVFSREGSNIRVNNWGELEGLSVGILENRTYILERLPRNTNVFTKSTDRAVLNGVVSGEYDVAVLSERSHEALSEGLRVVGVGQVDQLTEYLYLNKAHEEIVTQISDGLNALFVERIADKILLDLPIPEINTQKTIVHIISSNNEMEREENFSAALRSRFIDDMSVEWKTISLDAKRFPRDNNSATYIAHLLRADSVSRNVAAIIVSGNPALAFLIDYYYLYFRDVPVLFYGVDDQYKKIIQGYENNFTGIVDYLETLETLNVGLSIFPETKNVYIVNDYTPEGLQYKRAFEDQLDPLKNKLNIKYNEDISFNLLLAEIRSLPKDSLVFVGSYFVDGNRQYYPLSETRRLLARDCSVPILSIYSHDVAYNAIGGKCQDYQKYGEKIADMLEALLSGGKVQDIPVISKDESCNTFVFDKIQIAKFHVYAGALPAGSRIINTVPSLFETNPEYVISLVILLTISSALIIVLITFRIKERKHSKQIQAAAKRLEVAFSEAKRANQAKSTFVANMSHEIRTPLNSIVGFSELAMDDDIKPETKDYLEKIIENSNWLLNIINDILDILKIESGKMELECVPFNLHDIFTQCQTQFVQSANEKGVILHFYAEPTIGKKLLGDPIKLRQIYTNLLSNAIKFTNVGTVKLSSYVVNSDDSSCTICFEIRDSGIGMTGEQIENAFLPFSQVDASMTRRQGGTGLGLSITKSLIELMGGILTVESTLKVGSKFSFELTFRTIDIPDMEPSRETVTENIKKPTFKGDVLICEDNFMNQRVIREHLWRVGLKYELAINGKEAVDIVRRRKEAGEKPFDLIFMDIHMPVMDGLEATPKIIEMNTGSPIVAMTANIMTDDKNLYEKIGMLDCITKPFTSQDLWHCLLKYFDPLESTDQKADKEPDIMEDEEFRLQLLNDFVKDSRSKTKEIKEALEINDIKLAHRLAHSLKNNAGLVGKSALQKAAIDVEMSLKKGENLVTQAQMDLLETELHSSIEEIEPLLKKNATVPKISTQYVAHNMDRAMEVLESLEPLLKSGNLDSLGFIEDLRSIPGSEELIGQMEKFNFRPAALMALGILKQKLEVNNG